MPVSILSLQGYPGFNISMLSFYVTILIAGFISGVSMETCPEAEDLYPCECIQGQGFIVVQCSSGSLVTIRQTLKSLTGKNNVTLHLEFLVIDIPSDFFTGIVLEGLYFDYCRIDSLANDDKPMLLGLENHLEELGIFYSSTVPAKLSLGHLKKLRSITLMNSKNMTELSDDWLGSGPPSLESLYIYANNITKIGKNVFSRLNNLRYLQLEENRFGPIHRSMLPTTADKLEALYLDDNALTYLPIIIFNGMPSIKDISLKGNGLETLDERTWSHIWQQLETVQLDDNKIVCDDRLNWIIKSEKCPFDVSGKCSAPKEFEDMELKDFFRCRSL